MALTNELKDNEFFDLATKLKWLEQGTGVDVGKYRLSAKGLEAFNRFEEGQAAKDKVLTNLKLAANAYTTVAAIKTFMD
jgi:hypothetical protein